MIDTSKERPEFAAYKSSLIGQVHEYHQALRQAHEVLRMVRDACRRVNHPLSHQVVCPYCNAISEVLGE